MRMWCWIGCTLACTIGCDTAPAPGPHRPIEGIEEVSQPLSDLSAQCKFTSASHVLALRLNAGDIAVLAKASDGAIVVNDAGCGGATAATVRQINVTEATAGDQTLIIDYGGGLFATGVAGSPGITVDLGASGTDALKLIGTPGADNVVIGALGISVNGDSYLDVSIVHAGDIVVSLDDGNDTFSGAGNTATGGKSTAALMVYGGAGNDTLRGGAGNDTLNGGDGDDTFTTDVVADGNDVLIGGAGNDTADYTGRTADLTLSNDGTANDGETGETDNIGTDIEIIKAGKGNDTVTGGAGNDTLYGGPGNDILTGGDGNDILYGEDGDDSFVEGSMSNGNDTFNGGNGVDTVDYSSRTADLLVTLDGVAHSGENATGEADKVMADVENVKGGSGNDVISGSASDNKLEGGVGDDHISGGAGNDLIIGGDGDDVLSGGAGDDTFDEGSAENGNDTISGGAGIDTVDYSKRSVALTIVMDGATPSGELTNNEADLIGADVENLIGGSAADTITGNALDNTLEGGSGSAIDTINGGDGDDVIDGGGGTDIINCGNGDGDIVLDLTATKTACEL